MSDHKFKLGLSVFLERTSFNRDAASLGATGGAMQSLDHLFTDPGAAKADDEMVTGHNGSRYT